ncbi:DUF3999 domain-containing protein [Desulfobulbus sp. TB]|nr:DUF3999 domain-containing protein [Desulfobulbus sp. TB]
MKRLFWRIFLIFLMVIGHGTVWADNSWTGDEKSPLQRDDFAYCMELSISGKSSMYRFILPAAVYQGCTRADLGDLRVFNSKYPVPYIIQSQDRKQTKRAAQALPFFPLFNDMQDSNSSPSALHIATNSQGTIVNIRQNGIPAKKNQIVTAYILDTSGLQQPADWLDFTWTGQDRHFSSSVRLERSSDLNNWQVQVRSAALAELDFGGHTLVRKRIVMPQGIYRKTYLRLSWPAGQDGVTLTSVKAGYHQETEAHPRDLLSLDGEVLPITEPIKEPVTNQEFLRYQYDSKGVFPVDQLRVRLAEQNSLAQITVFSRANKKASWQRRTSLLAYRLLVDNISLDSAILDLHRTTDRYWLLEMESNSGIRQAPVLELGWLPGQLLFLAQGEQPYTLAYGRAGLKPTRYQVDQLLRAVDPQREKKLVALAQVGPEKILGGRERLVVDQELPWRRWLLWLVLLAGVLVVGMMAFKLYREMNEERPSGDA